MIQNLAAKAQEILDSGEANQISGAIVQVCETLNFDTIRQIINPDNADHVRELSRCEAGEPGFGISRARQLAHDIINGHLARQRMLAKRAARKADQ